MRSGNKSIGSMDIWHGLVASKDPVVTQALAYVGLDSFDPDGPGTHARQEITTHPTTPLRHMDLGYGVKALSWHPDCLRIAFALIDSRVRVYDISSNLPKEKFTIKGNGILTLTTDLAFSPDGARLATGYSNKRVQLWGAASGQSLLGIRHGSAVEAVAFSPDGTRLATCGGDSVRIWDVANGKQLLKIDHRHVRALAFSPDGARLASGGTDIRIWDAASGEQLLKIEDYFIVTMAFSPDGAQLATGIWNLKQGAERDCYGAKIWNSATGKQLLKVRHDTNVRSVAFGPAGVWLATGGDDNTARVWDAASGKQLSEFRHDKRVNSVAFSPDFAWLATGGDDSARIWPIGGL